MNSIPVQNDCLHGSDQKRVKVFLLSCVIIGRALYRAVRQCHNGERFREGGGVHDSYTFPVQTGGNFYIPWHRHHIEGTDGF